MRSITLFILCLLLTSVLQAQDENPVPPGGNTEQQLENLAEQQDGETEDDAYLQSLVQLRKNPLNLNAAEENDLKDLRMLTDLQVQSFLRYRRLLGMLVSIYELQAIPGWDLETIQKVLPYVRAGSALTLKEDLGKRLAGGQHSILLRAQQILEKSEGYLRPDSILNRYYGSPQRFMFRYKYIYRNLLQYGITGDKDAGEQFFKGKQSNGFDFYSFHLFARKLGPVKLLALGDYVVNLGQGLIHWQSLAFKKSADITAIKRQADVLRPYNSAGEFNFMRGAGATMGSKHFDVTGFVSVRKMDGTLNVDTVQNNEDFLSSIISSGYHRTPNEIDKKNTLTQTAYGGNLSYRNNSLHLGINAIAFQFSRSLLRDMQPYNQYAIRGKGWSNYSFDYSYTFRNVHVFGEAAFDRNRSKAFIGGLLASLDTKVDASLVYRNIQRSYQTLYGNAFTESTSPSNENGLFAGIAIKPQPSLRIDAYADVFSFPWLRYGVDAPTKGSEYLVQLTYKPSKQVEVYTRFRNENKGINSSGLNLPTRMVYITPRDNWRTNLTYKASRNLTLKERVELMWFAPQDKDRGEKGFLMYSEAGYKPFGKPYAAAARLQYFETDGYNSRIYAFETDVLYSYSIPMFAGKGLRYYVNFNYDIGRRMTVWLRWAQTVYANQTSVGSGLDKIEGNRRTEVKAQLLCSF